MPKRVTKALLKAIRKAARKLPTATIPRGQEEIAEVKPPGALLGELMIKPDSVGKVPAEESGELIVWDNRQRTP